MGELHRITDNDPNNGDNIKMHIKQMENDKLTEWKRQVTSVVHSSTSKFLLKTTEKGLLVTNFDDDVSKT